MRWSRQRAQRVLAVIWVGSALVLGLAVAVLMQGLAQTGLDGWDAVGWALTAVFPTTMMVVGTLVAEGRGASAKVITSGFLFGLALATSVTYLSIVAIILWGSVISPTPMDVVELRRFDGLLGAFQGIVAALLAYFFARSSVDEGAGG